MVVHTCLNCGKEFKKKSDFIDHTEKKKKPCQPLQEIPPKTAENRRKNQKSAKKSAKNGEILEYLKNEEKIFNEKNENFIELIKNFSENSEISIKNLNELSEKNFLNIDNFLNIEKTEKIEKLNNLENSDKTKETNETNEINKTNKTNEEILKNIPIDNKDLKPIKGKGYFCSFCGLHSKRKDSIDRHLRLSCKVKKLQEQEKETIFELLLEREKQLEEKDKLYMKQLEDKEKQIENLTQMITELNQKMDKYIDRAITKNINKGIINQNTNIIIPINNFGSENLTNIDPKRIIDSMKKSGVNGLLNCFNDIFNNDPRNKTVYITDKSREKIMTWQDNKWRLNNMTQTIIKIMDQIEKYLEINKQRIENGQIKIKNDPDGKQLLNKFEKNLYKYIKLYNGEDIEATQLKIDTFVSYMDKNLKLALCNIKEEVLANYEKIKAEIELDKDKNKNLEINLLNQNLTQIK